MYYESNNELYHFGIKGMKWGVRRYQNKDGTLTSKGKSRYASGSINQNKTEMHDDYARRHSKKKISEMSDEELKDRIGRMQMEQQYMQMSAQAKRGESKVDKIIKAGTTVATLTGTAITIYNNSDKILKIIMGMRAMK